MDYVYESLNDERFQKLCQAILVTSHPAVQCLPVGQPDGGRDAVEWSITNRRRRETTVFQVKFSKNPSTKDAREVIEELIKTEGPKIQRLKERGLENYYLLTNVAGTSHPDVGSIDRVNAELTAAFDVPAFCWWRDDLDRRIDANASVKWSFPEILRGSDMLQALYEGRFGVDENRRLNAIRAYLAYQYKYDSQLKFKQVDLEKGLIDLFVDVPAVAVGPADPNEKEKWRERSHINPVFAALTGDDHRRHGRDEDDRVGAVRALVEPAVTTELPRVVIEGAPGQGKSTVTQFLCQLHRMLLLKKNYELGKVPSELKPTSVRLPLRVDLRDYATWLSGRSPFGDAAGAPGAGTFSPALESFLAAQIAAQSGGLQFSPDDLLAFASSSALLIVLDGFDEVADIATRNRLVREISDASTRFEGNAISNQVIVTSRPAAFANSPGFPRNDWQYIQILPLTKPTIARYTDKWLAGHNLDHRERQEIISVLNEKLEYPHVRELARNPMQLAILLALISTQGASLPDKRTTLYDRYIDIFFNRESEKSKVVRDKRDLLIDMHRYLAWTLQVEAESDAKAGNISEQRLREVLRTHLSELGHDPSLIDDLFTGMVERVVALVSRVQGTFEFEVQPLREYFAARYLYDTSPYIQAGSRRGGSIMDRFDALARNAYWLNVTRFYCGCYSTGELPSLVDGLIAIGLSEQFSGTAYVGELSTTLLGDYVFSQQPRSVTRLTEFLFETDRFRLMLAAAYHDREDLGIILPAGSGQEKIFDVSVEAYRQANNFDTAYTAASFIKSNISDRDIGSVWLTAKDHFDPETALFFGSYLDIVEGMTEQEAFHLVETGGPAALRVCVYRDRWDVLAMTPELWVRLIKLALDGGAWMGFHPSENELASSRALLSRLILSLVAAITSLSEDDDREYDCTLMDHHARHYGNVEEKSISDCFRGDDLSDLDAVLPLVVRTAADELASAKINRSSEFELKVSHFLDVLVDQFGDRIQITEAAISAVRWFGRGTEMVKFHGTVATLADVMAHADDSNWWSNKFELANDGDRLLLLAKAYLSLTNSENIRSSMAAFSKGLDDLPVAQFHALYSSKASRHSPYRQPSELFDPHFEEGDLRQLGYRFAAIMMQWVEPRDHDTIFDEILVNYDGSDKVIEQARVDGAWYYAQRNPEFWPSALEIISAAYRSGVTLNVTMSAPIGVIIPIPEARRIVQSPMNYPLNVLICAEKAIAQLTGSQVIPVGSIAARDEWFSER